MKILIAYATTEGQTRKIVRFVADWLADNGHAVELWPVAEAGDVDIERFDRAILAASVHLNRLQSAMETFVARHKAALDGIETLFLAVSLSAAGDDPKDRAGLAEVVKGFTAKTGWVPKRLDHVAGAFRFTQYDFFRSWAMRWIASQTDQAVERDKDKEYTDWKALEETLRSWLNE